MMDFDVAIERILSHEGGLVDDPRDPGGLTNWGICRRSYPVVDIRNLTRDGAKEIYRADFWEPIAATVADPALRFQMLDAAVNHGAGNAVRMLQRAIGAAPDGHWGPHSSALLAGMDAHDAHLLFLAERFDFWCALSTFNAFGRGWTRRGAANLRYLAGDN